jgi:hypothetical protein
MNFWGLENLLSPAILQSSSTENKNMQLIYRGIQYNPAQEISFPQTTGIYRGVTYSIRQQPGRIGNHPLVYRGIYFNCSNRPVELSWKAVNLAMA